MAQSEQFWKRSSHNNVLASSIQNAFLANFTNGHQPIKPMLLSGTGSK